MNAGFEVGAQDGSNVLQIDSTYRNLFMRRKGSGTTTTNYFVVSGGNVSYVTINLGSYNQRPMVAVRCTALVSIGSILQNGDGTWSAAFYVRAEIGASFAWYAFDTITNADLVKPFLAVWDASFNPLFSAGNLPMRVVGTATIDGSNNATISLASGLIYAAVISIGGRMQPVATSASVILANGVSVNGGSVLASQFQIASIAESSTLQNRPSYVLAVDVTGY